MIRQRSHFSNKIERKRQHKFDLGGLKIRVWRLKIDQEKRNFDIFRPRIFRKIAKTNSKLYCGQTTRKNENFKELIFSFESA